MEQSKYTPCGGCGATEPIQRCIGCFHPFTPKNCHIEWVNLASHFTEDWQIMHCRYASDGYKLDTDLFELKDGGLVKKGGIGRVELKEVEYMVDLGASEIAALRARAERMEHALNKIIEMNRQHAEDQYGDPDKSETWGCVRVAREALESQPVSVSDNSGYNDLFDYLHHNHGLTFLESEMTDLIHVVHKFHPK